ncbi:MAG: D-2-hydroxyacid dehydrogenase [Acidimicrobiia bacterium]
MRVLISIQQPVAQWQIPPAGVETLCRRFPGIEFVHATTPGQRAQGLRDCDVAYTWILKAPEIVDAPRLQWVHTSAVAVETICLPELFARGIAVSNSRGVQAVPIAEHVMAVTLAFAKHLPFALEQQRTATWAQNQFMGDRLPWLLKGKTLGLIGVGTIGSEIAARANAFGMRVIAMRRRATTGAPGIERMFGPGQLYPFLSQCDVLVIAAPLTPQTHSLLGEGPLAQLPKGAIVINVGRAKILDTDALMAALESGHLGGASLDVFPAEPLPPEHRRWKMPNVILTPHTSGFRQGHWDDVVELFAENLERFRRGEPLKFRVEPELGY